MPLAFSVGQPIPPEFGNMSGVDMGARLSISKDEIMAVVAIPDVSKPERKILRNDPIRIGLFRSGDALFLMMRIGKAFEFDMSLNVGIIPEEMRGVPDRDADEGLAMSVVAFDSNTNNVVGLRFFTITPKFARLLEENIAELSERCKEPNWNFTGDHSDVLKRFPSPTPMWAHCEIIEQAGKKFAGRKDLR